MPLAIGLAKKMARVTVKMFATVREAAGASSVQLEVKDTAELLAVLKETYGPHLSEIIDGYLSDPDRLVLLINGRNPGRSLVLSEDLSSGDEVAIFPPVSGG
jgi:molybdopterin synthase sulfur carrier subunit